MNTVQNGSVTEHITYQRLYATSFENHLFQVTKRVEKEIVSCFPEKFASTPGGWPVAGIYFVRIFLNFSFGDI